MPSNNMNPVLHIRNLNKTFGTTAALRDINLELRQGEMLFLLGPSGCGKTTLLRAIAGFEQPDSGEIWLKDRCIFNSRFSLPTQQRRIGYVVQEGVLFPHLSVYRNIAYGLGNGKGSIPQDRQRIEAVMSLTGIGELANRFPHQLSGGQQQRVALARALAPEPELILFDEPFSALDEHLRQKIRREMLHALRQSGTSAIFVTHDRDEALSHADRIAVLSDGRILQTDTPRRLYWSPSSLAAAQFIGDSVVLDAQRSSDGTQAQCALGIFPLAAAPQTPSEHPIDGKLLVRPEQFVLTETANVPPHSTQPVFGAKVESIEFKGRYTAVALNINGVCFTLDTVHAPPVCSGDTVRLAFEGTALFFPPQQE